MLNAIGVNALVPILPNCLIKTSSKYPTVQYVLHDLRRLACIKGATV